MTDLRELFTSGTPLLDVRAPVEFSKGAFPHATNIPILNDEQRHQVGVCYQEHGPEAAETLGFELVEHDKLKLINDWQSFIARHPDARLYCFRGGKRSQIAAQWLVEAGTPIERISGGYKRLRSFLLDQINKPPPIVLLSGRTGVGKTLLLPKVQNAIDLEALANHRGSAFGKQRTAQPAQIDFENQLAIEFLKVDGFAVLEDESRLIGKINIPPPVQEAMKRAPIYVLEDSLENRVARIYDEYVASPLKEIGEAELRQQLHDALSAIQRRLGGVRYEALTNMLDLAFDQQDATYHKRWIETLLTDYYDPMYDYQLDKKRDRVLKTLSWTELAEQQVLDLRPDGS